tara:strand:+ start:1001 stop:1189 length:189 start_codon:yes stop_codon:yes gene_type:complete
MIQDWFVRLRLHWPHDRFMLGWQYIGANEECKWTEIEIGLGIATVDLIFGYSEYEKNVEEIE